MPWGRGGENRNRVTARVIAGNVIVTPPSCTFRLFKLPWRASESPEVQPEMVEDTIKRRSLPIRRLKEASGVEEGKS
jgi:hypothetical protein